MKQSIMINNKPVSQKTTSIFYSGLADDKSGCKIWTKHTDKKGYGRITVNCKPMRTHRFAMVLNNINLTPEVQVCHKCDNPPCCNIEHLFLASNSDNMRDRYLKGRYKGLPGKNNPMFGLRGKDHPSFGYKHTEDAKKKIGESKRGEKSSSANLKKVDALYIRNSTLSCTTLSNKFNVSRKLISLIKNRKRWKYINENDKGEPARC